MANAPYYPLPATVRYDAANHCFVATEDIKAGEAVRLFDRRVYAELKCWGPMASIAFLDASAATKATTNPYGSISTEPEQPRCKIRHSFERGKCIKCGETEWS